MVHAVLDILSTLKGTRSIQSTKTWGSNCTDIGTQRAAKVIKYQISTVAYWADWGMFGNTINTGVKFEYIATCAYPKAATTIFKSLIKMI
jgi:hypothetical protein